MKNLKALIFTLLVLVGQGELFAQKNVRNFTRKSAQLTDSIPVLNAKKDWLITVKSLDSLIGGSKSVGENTIQLSNGLGGFFDVDTTIIDEGDTLNFYFGLVEDRSSLILGLNNIATEGLCAVFGGNNLVSGIASFSSGYLNQSTGQFAATFGAGNIAAGLNSFAFGAGNVAYSDYSTAFGAENIAAGLNSFALGAGNVSKARASVAMGEFSLLTNSDSAIILSTDTVFAYGNGINNGSRSNALTLQRNGNLGHTGAYANSGISVYSGTGNATIPNNISTFIYDPGSLQASVQLTLPSSPLDGQIQRIAFGGTISSGTVVTSLSFNTSGGQTINIGTAGGSGTVENPLTFQFVSTLNKWYLISN